MFPILPSYRSKHTAQDTSTLQAGSTYMILPIDERRTLTASPAAASLEQSGEVQETGQKLSINLRTE